MTNNKQKYLFLFTIGPVQSFIAQARKTQDLYAGSKILTELCRAGLNKATKLNAIPIFPSEEGMNDKQASLPNRFLVKFDRQIDEPEKIGQNIEIAVRTYWKEQICKRIMNYKHINGVEEQLDQQLEIHWVFNTYTNDYKTAYETIERLLGAVKNARQYVQFAYQQDIIGEKGRKCSVDGERNVKFYRATDKEQDEKEAKINGKPEKYFVTKARVFKNKLFVERQDNEVKIFDHNDQKNISFGQLRNGEGLSAVSMVKRLYKPKGQTKEEFHSTTEIALKYELDLIENGNNQELKDLLRCYKDLFSENACVKACIELFNKRLTNKVNFNCQDEHQWKTHFDEQLLYEDNLTQKNIPNKNQRELAQKVHKELQPHLKQKYYAIINFDGDKMGEWLGGKNVTTDLDSFHNKLSKYLTDFGKKAKEIVNQYGQTVYAGGDDFLGFLNLHYLFAAMNELRIEFKRLVNDPLTPYRSKEISFSAGVCIAHYKEPLSLVLGKAAAAQKKAKNEDKGKRNAFCITASKHSGENHHIYYKWGEIIKINGVDSYQNVANLNEVVEELSQENFSNTFITSIHREFSRMKTLPDEDNKTVELSCDSILLKTEIKRLVTRACTITKNNGESKEDFKARKKKACNDFSILLIEIYENSNHDFENFLEALSICDFLKRKKIEPKNESSTNTIPQPA